MVAPNVSIDTSNKRCSTPCLKINQTKFGWSPWIWHGNHFQGNIVTPKRQVPKNISGMIVWWCFPHHFQVSKVFSASQRLGVCLIFQLLLDSHPKRGRRSVHDQLKLTPPFSNLHCQWKTFPVKILKNGVNPVDKIYRSLNSTQEKVWDEVLRREQVMAEEAIPFGESLGELFRSNRVNDQRVADHLGFLKWWLNGGL